MTSPVLGFTRPYTPFWPVNHRLPFRSNVAVFRLAFLPLSGNRRTSLVCGSTRTMAFWPPSVARGLGGEPHATVHRRGDVVRMRAGRHRVFLDGGLASGGHGRQPECCKQHQPAERTHHAYCRTRADSLIIEHMDLLVVAREAPDLAP